MPEFVTHPLIRPKTIAKRLYQETIIGTAVRWNTLVILPTGVGKTIIAVLAAAYRLHKLPDSKCVFLAPTKPLVLQHLETFRRTVNLPAEQMQLMTGEVPPSRRQRIWESARLLFMTPQVLQNDLLASRYTLRDVSLLVVDEAHRAVGDYAYVFIAEQYFQQSSSPLLLALTASPGSELEKIREICRNLHIENIELRTRESPDVAPYIAPLKFEWREVKLPEKFRQVGKLLNQAIKSRLTPLKEAGVLDTSDPRKVTVRSVLEVQREIQRRIAAETQPPSILFQLVSHCAALLRLYHCLELLETQGISALHNFLVGITEEARRGGASKAIRSLAEDPYVQDATLLAAELIAEGVEHPKLAVLASLVKEQLDAAPSSRIIVFTRFRDTARLLESTLKKVPGATPVRFIGQASRGDDRGLTQREQGQILQAFKEGSYNVLVATSVGEEGLDIQECDLVIFYEAVPSAVRLIQRRGRTGRTRPGRVVVLVALGTRDEGYYWSAIRRESQMKELLRAMRKMSKEFAQDRKQATLRDFFGQPQEPQEPREATVRIVVDSRELRSEIAKTLKRLGAQLQVETLEVGDYLLSDRVGVEVKTAGDFTRSIIDHRLFNQLAALQDSFPVPLLVIAGPNLYEAGVNPEAIRGALASALVDFRVPILFVPNESEAARLLFSIARREQRDHKPTFALRGGKPPLSLPALQEYIVAGLPGVNTTLARRLLSSFGSVRAVFQATPEQLEKVHGIGKNKARTISKALDTPYPDKD